MRFSLLILLSLIGLVYSKLVKRLEYPIVAADEAISYQWKITRYGSNRLQSHHILIAEPIMTSKGKPVTPSIQKITENGVTRELYHGYLRSIDLIAYNNGIPGSGEISIRQQLRPRFSPGDSWNQVGRSFITDGFHSGIDITTQTRVMNQGRFAEGATYLLIGNNCQNFAGQTMSKFMEKFPGKLL